MLISQRSTKVFINVRITNKFGRTTTSKCTRRLQKMERVISPLLSTMSTLFLLLFYSECRTFLD